MKDDLISRQVALKEIEEWISALYENAHHESASDWKMILNAIKHLPSAQPEIKPIDYQDCANAMLRMWMDNVVTDGEYNRIMDKLNAFWSAKHE